MHRVRKHQKYAAADVLVTRRMGFVATAGITGRRGTLPIETQVLVKVLGESARANAHRRRTSLQLAVQVLRIPSARLLEEVRVARIKPAKTELFLTKAHRLAHHQQ